MTRDTSAMSSDWQDDAPMGGYPPAIPRDPFACVATIHPTARIHPSASVGSPGEDRRRPDPPNLGVDIGERVIVRECATVNGGMERVTRVGAGTMLMARSHVGHDCELGEDVTICTGAILGGHTRVHEGATLGLGAITHPKVTIGAYAYVGAGAVVVRDVPPFATVVGCPAKVIGVNRVGMERAGFSNLEVRIAADGAPSGTPRIREAWARFDGDRLRHR